MYQIKVYKGTSCVATTSKAFAVCIKKELMKEYDINFSVVNNNPARKYLLPGNVIQADGQLFDITGIKQSSGTTNKTDILAYHVGYRLSNYTMPIGYSFVGTSSAILEDILDTATDTNGNMASTEFSAGTCADVGTVSFSLENEQETTARAAILALTKIGVEVEFNNFEIDLPETCGSGNTKTFEFGVDLCDFERSYDSDKGWTYNVKIADLQRIPGHSGDVFAVGDTCTIKDKFIGDEITQRIIRYSKYDDPTQDSITMGLFALDLADIVIETSAKVKSSVQQGEKYSNISITHENGFGAINRAGNIMVLMNADDCFAVYVKQSSGYWEKVTTVTTDGVEAGKIRTRNSQVYGIIGTNSDSTTGLQIIDSVGNVKFCEILELFPGGGMVIANKDRPVMYVDDNRTTVEWHNGSNSSKLQLDVNGAHVQHNGNWIGINGTIPIGGGNIEIENGLVSNFTGYSYISGSFSIGGVGTLNFDHGMLVSVT